MDPCSDGFYPDLDLALDLLVHRVRRHAELWGGEKLFENSHLEGPKGEGDIKIYL
jgi:hypothetical protein